MNVPLKSHISSFVIFHLVSRWNWGKGNTVLTSVFIRKKTLWLTLWLLVFFRYDTLIYDAISEFLCNKQGINYCCFTIIPSDTLWHHFEKSPVRVILNRNILLVLQDKFTGWDVWSCKETCSIAIHTKIITLRFTVNENMNLLVRIKFLNLFWYSSK